MLYAYNVMYHRSLYMALPIYSLLFLVCIFTGCSDASSSGERSVSLNKIPWCNNQTTMVFTDDRASTVATTPVPGASTNTLGLATDTPVALKNWNTLQMYLGFVVFLPPRLPSGSCLLSSSGFVHNAVFGSNFTLTYLLPDQTSLTIAQSPQTGKNTAFQCSAVSNTASSSSESNSSTQIHEAPTYEALTSKVELCTATRETTNITFSASWNKQELEQFFQDLQPNVDWMPHS